MKNNMQSIPTAYFGDKIYVKCPQCTSLGVVNAVLQNNNLAIAKTSQQHFSCTKCSYSISGTTTWHGYYVGKMLQNCKFCGSNLGFKTKPTKNKVDTQKVGCATCHNEYEYELFWERHTRNIAKDPHFGLDLWFQTNIKSNNLWLYNLEHLEFLKDYVSSRLREDGQRNKYSLTTNLPQWLKDAKNRDLIVKKLNKLRAHFMEETK